MRNERPKRGRKRSGTTIFPRISILHMRIEWVPGIEQACAADGEKSFHPGNRLDDDAVRLAGLKLALQLKKGVIGPVEPVR